MSRYSNLKVTTKNAEATIEGEIPQVVTETYKQEALKQIQENFELSGFRKGQVPLDIIEKKVSAVYVLEEAADLALQDVYPEIIVAENLKALGRPQVTITKLAPGNPIGFTIRIGLLPDVSLPDYKKIAASAVAGQKPAVVEDKEIDQTIDQILQIRKKTPDEPTAKLTDELVKTLGAFENVADLKAKVRLSIEEEKESETRRARREAIAAALTEATKIAIPEIVIEEELHALHEDRDHELRRAGVTMETYLKNMNTSAEELTKQERGYVERQIKTKFIFQKIAEVEKVVASDIEIGGHVDALRRRHPDVDLERLHAYVRSMIVNEKVLELLEGKPETKIAALPEKPTEKQKEEEKKAEAKAEQKPAEKKSDKDPKPTPKSGMVF